MDRLRLPEIKAGKTAIDVLPFLTGEVVELAVAARGNGDVEVADAIVIGAFTGARLEEIASLRAEHVVDDFADIILPGTKTDAAARRLPVHPDLAPLLRRMVAAASEDFLFPALSENKFGDRSNGLGKRFGKLKTNAGFGRNKVFHSIRKTWASQLWSAEVHPDLIDQMIGHKTRLSIDVYARDPARATKLKAIQKLSFPGILGA